MLNIVSLRDEITVWWEKPWDATAYSGIIRFNGEKEMRTDKTYCTFSFLSPETEYRIEVEIYDGNILLAKETTAASTAADKKRVDVTLFGAVGDGKTMNTFAIQRAADALKKDEYLYFPSGVYLTGSVCLHGDTELYIDDDAVIKGSEDFNDYLPKIKTRFEGIEVEAYSPLIRVGQMDSKAGQTTENIFIRGKGAILGGGVALCESVIKSEKERLKDYLAANADYVNTCENDRTIPGRARPLLIDIANASNVVVSGLTFGYGAAWNLHVLYSKNINVFGCDIISQGVWNGDGIDPDSSENMAIFDCGFRTHDDAIAVKSGKNPEGNIINRPMKNLRIFDCRGRNGIALGSEMSGGIDDVYIWDCSLIDSYSGLRAKVTRKRGGYIRNVRVRDCKLTSVSIIPVSFNDDGKSAGKLPEVEKFSIKNVELQGFMVEQGVKKPTPAIEIRGFTEQTENFGNIMFDGVRILSPAVRGTIVIDGASNVMVNNVEYPNCAIGRFKLCD